MSVYDTTQKIERNYKVNVEGHEYYVKETTTYRPEHITACDVEDFRGEFEIKKRIVGEEEQKVIQEITDYKKKNPQDQKVQFVK